MKYVFKIVVVLVCFSFISKEGVHNLKSYKVSTKSNAVELLIPEKLNKLTNEEAISTYGMARTPMAIFVDEQKDVSIIISVKPLPTGDVSDLDLNLEKSFKRSALTSGFGKVNIIKEELTEINGYQAILFEFDAFISGKDSKEVAITSKNYNYIAYFYKKDREYSVNFNVPASLKEVWKDDAALIINSVKVK